MSRRFELSTPRVELPTPTQPASKYLVVRNNPAVEKRMASAFRVCADYSRNIDKQVPRSRVAFLPCASPGCKCAVTRPNASHCCISCKNGKGRHSKSCKQFGLQMYFGDEWHKLKPCATPGCMRAVASHAGPYCSASCPQHRGRSYIGHDNTRSDICLAVSSGGPTEANRRLATRVDQRVTSAGRTLYSAGVTNRKYAELRTSQILAPQRSKIISSRAEIARRCAELYEAGQRLAHRKQETQQKRELQLSTMMESHMKASFEQRQERQRLYEMQNPWLMC